MSTNQVIMTSIIQNIFNYSIVKSVINHYHYTDISLVNPLGTENIQKRLADKRKGEASSGTLCSNGRLASSTAGSSLSTLLTL